ncbi:S8 family peptidase [Siccirubricoccus deserti]|uniref:S8 family peptidase n=1 Tax=Siccirubricoccus deserti TaxID=2013562 RepID=UPI001C95099C|nr:S8 family peptidase [Siccirubricoccus deserti]
MLNDAVPLPEEAPPASPDFTGRQGYLDAAPGGVDARWAWTQPGGRGDNVNIIDVEGAWRFTHEDLQASQGGVVGGTQSGNLGWRNHGTAVVGVYGGDINAIGITGIAPASVSTAYSIFGSGNSSAAAIRGAASRMRAGDILLIELHRPGPRHNFASRDDQAGYIAVEWWPDDFAAILFATGRGVIVVEAAGNGAENLDDAIYNTRPQGFPTTWRNPFNRANPDCGAVVVGAGAPSTLNHGPDRSRLDFSNFGACVDAQGWGRDVCTAGYGNLQGGSNEDLWYTGTFSGTSSASPVVVGALASLQGILRHRGATLLTPARARQLLRSTGSPQTDAPGRPATQRIGNRPDIRAMAQSIFGKGVLKDVKDKEKVEIKENIKDIKDKDKDKEKREVKEIKEKEFKEVKDGKEVKEKDLKDIRDNVQKRKEVLENKVREVIDRIQPTSAAELEARVSALEVQLAHFIGQGLRPDVGGGTYADPQGEASRIQALQQEAQAQLDAAKQAKDYKDSEV